MGPKGSRFRLRIPSQSSYDARGLESGRPRGGARGQLDSAICFTVLIGQWADEKTGLEPTCTLIGIVVGLAVAAVGGYRMLLPFIRKVSYTDPEQG